MQSDEQLIEAWRSGRTEAGEALFERYYDSVYRFFCNKVGPDIRDLVQQTFVACVEGRDRLREGRPPVRFTGDPAVARHEIA